MTNDLSFNFVTGLVIGAMAAWVLACAVFVTAIVPLQLVLL